MLWNDYKALPMGPGGPETWFPQPFLRLHITKTSPAWSSPPSHGSGARFWSRVQPASVWSSYFLCVILQAQRNEDSVLEAPSVPTAVTLRHLEGAVPDGFVVPPSQLEKRSCPQPFSTQATLHLNQIQTQLSSNSQQMRTLQWWSEETEQKRKLPDLKG